MINDFGIYFGVHSWMTGLPRPVLVGLFKLYYGIEPKTLKEDNVSFTVLVPSFHYDYLLVREMQGMLEKFKEINAEILLIGGNKSPSFLKNTLDALEEVLSNVKRVELQGLSHSGPLVTGDPRMVAQELKHFFIK